MAKIVFRIIFGVVMAVLLLGLLAGAAVMAYNAGVSQGLVQSGKLALPQNGQSFGVMPYYGVYPPFFHPFGFLGLIPLVLGTLFFLFLISRVFFFGRMAHGGGMRRHFDRWGEGSNQVPPMVEEWHKRMHSQPDDLNKTGASSTPS